MMNEWILSSSVLIAAVLLGRILLRGKISLRLQYALWLVVLIRLLLPVQLFTSDFGAGSMAQAVDVAEPVRQVYVSAREDAYEREYDAAYSQVVAEYQAALQTVDPVHVEREAQTRAQRSLELDLNKLLYGAWFAGMIVMTAVIAACNVHLGLRLKRRRWEYPAADSLLPVYVTEAVPTPCIFGLFHPVIYLTPQAAGDERVRNHVLTHELTHYRHGDHIWSVLRSVCLVLHWYNPLVWMAAKVSRADAELACDEGALARLGEEHRADYGRTLIGLTCPDNGSSMFVTATTMTGSAGSIRERIKLLMKRPRNTMLALTAVVLIGTIIVGCAFAGAPETTAPAETTPPGVDLPTSDDPSSALLLEQAMADYADKNPRKLTAEEIIQVRDAFASTVYDVERDEYSVTPVAAFFTSWYDDVSKLDLAEFLRYFPTSGEATEEEFQLLHQKYGADFDWSEHATLQDMPVPVHRYEITYIDEILRRYADIPFAELQNKDTVYYLEETGCYYNFTSDFGPGSFICVDGFVYDGGAVLYSENAALFLTETMSNYSISAHLPVADGNVDNDMSYTDKDLPIADDPESIDYFNDLLNPDLYRSEADWYPQALTSYYDSPAGIDLFQFFYNGIPGADNTLSESELAFLEDQPGYEPDFDLDRIPAREMDRVLAEYFGITLPDTARIGLANFIYNPDTDCYYHCHTDTNLSFRTVYSVEALTEMIWRVRYTSDIGDGEVILRLNDGAWQIASHLPVETSSLLRSDGMIVFPGTEWNMTEAEVLEALNLQDYGRFSGMRGFYTPEATFWGYPVEMALYFDQYTKDTEWGLFGAIIRFENEADFDAVRDILLEQLGSPDFQTSGVSFECWNSDVRTEELVSAAAYEQYLQERTVSITENNIYADGAAVTVSCYGAGTSNEYTICFDSWHTKALQIEAALGNDPTAEITALFGPEGYPMYRSALAVTYSDAHYNFDPAVFFSAGQTDVTLTDEEKALVTEVYGADAVKNTVFRMDYEMVDETLESYVGADSSFMDMSEFLFCPETRTYLLVREDVPRQHYPRIHAIDVLADDQVRMIYTLPDSEQQYVATLLKGKNWKVYSNQLLVTAPAGARALTEEEIEQVSAAFSPSYYDAAADETVTNPRAAFLLDMYSDISEMSRSKFLSYYPASEYCEDEAEFQLLKQKYPQDFENEQTIRDMNWPIHRIPASVLKAVMEEYTLADWEDLPDGGWYHYLEETDCYYTYYSDVGLFGFHCTGGWVYDGGAMLTSRDAVLYLTERNGTYYIQSHLPAMVAE